MVTCVVVTHGLLAAELLRTAQSIIGDVSASYAISNTGKSPQVVKEEIARALDEHADAPTIIFTDFFGGSCSNACLEIEHEREDVRLITGVNLPMMLAFFNKRDEVPFEQLPDEIIDRAHKSIMILDQNAL